MRPVVLLGMLGGGLIVSTGLAVAFLGRPGPDTARPAGPGSMWAAGGRARDAELTAEVRAAEGRIRVKREVAAALVRGELTTDRAAGRFRTLLAEEPLVLAQLRRDHPAATDTELAVRQMITFIRVVAPADSERAAALVRALEQQFPAGAKAPGRSRVVPGPPDGGPPTQGRTASLGPRPAPSVD